jgi:glycosyltransferase involved in cell wall biosynthesis
MANIKKFLFVDVSPLWEIEYTGISNVVYELASRFLFNPPKNCDLNFTVFHKKVDIALIENCIKMRSGLCLQERKDFFLKDEGIVKTDSNGHIDKNPTIGLFLHVKPAKKTYTFEGFLFYDFSFFITPECHTKETIQFHSNQLDEQIKTTDVFFAISESTKKDLVWLYNIQEKNCHVALLGGNHDQKHAIAAKNKIGSCSVEPFFLVLGTIEPRKNIGIVLAWLSKNQSILQNFKVVFAGRQGWGKPFNEYISEYNLTSYYKSERIVHLGYVDERLKATLLVSAKALIFPSFFEGFGLPVLEAMSLGVAVIASCSTSIPEVLGECGYYFDPYSIESLGRAIEDFISDSKNNKLDPIRNTAKTRSTTFSYDQTYHTIISKMGLLV